MQLFMAEMRFQHNAGNAFSAVLFFYSIIESRAAGVLEALCSTRRQMTKEKQTRQYLPLSARFFSNFLRFFHIS